MGNGKRFVVDGGRWFIYRLTKGYLLYDGETLSVIRQFDKFDQVVGYIEAERAKGRKKNG